MLTGTAIILSTHEECEHLCYTRAVFLRCTVSYLAGKHMLMKLYNYSCVSVIYVKIL